MTKDEKKFYVLAALILVVGLLICTGIAINDNGDNEIPSGPALNKYQEHK